MAEAASTEKPKKPHRHRVALAVTALLVAFVVLALPFVIFSIVVELLGKPDELMYSLTAERPLRPALAGNRQQSASYLNILIDDIDEATRVATLRISGQRACTTDCPAFTLVFVYLLIQRVWQERTAENLDLLETLLDRTAPGSPVGEEAR